MNFLNCAHLCATQTVTSFFVCFEKMKRKYSLELKKNDVEPVGNLHFCMKQAKTLRSHLIFHSHQYPSYLLIPNANLNLVLICF